MTFSSPSSIWNSSVVFKNLPNNRDHQFFLKYFIGLQFVSPYFTEILEMGRALISELEIAGSASAPNAQSQSTLYGNLLSESLKTTWHTLLEEAVAVAESLIPPTVVPPMVFRDALSAFSFFFRELPDRLPPSSAAVEEILKALGECKKTLDGGVKYTFGNESKHCPQRVCTCHTECNRGKMIVLDKFSSGYNLLIVSVDFV
jgi:hypothetical protein